MIVKDMEQKEKILAQTELGIENKAKLDPDWTTEESITRQWLSSLFDLAYALGEKSGLRIAKNIVQHSSNEMETILNKDPQ